VFDSRFLLQGCQLAGSSEEKVGLEGAPPTLLDSVTMFLNTQRAALRQEASGLAGCITTGATSLMLAYCLWFDQPHSIM
jgi:hypothetical protein